MFKEGSTNHKIFSPIVLKRDSIVYYLDCLIALVFTLSLVIVEFEPEISFIFLRLNIILCILRFIIDRNISFKDKTILYLIIAFVIIQIITSLISDYPKESIYIDRIRSYYYVTLFIPVIFIKNIRQLKIILSTLIIISAVLSFYELYFFIHDIIYFHFSPAMYRLYVFEHPTTTGEIKMMVILIIFPFLFIKENFVFNKPWLIVLSIPIFISCYFTYTRIVFFALLISIVLISFIRNKKIAFTITVLSLCFLYFAPLSIDARILSSFDINYPSNKSRIYIFETGINMIKDHPITGIGSAKFKEEYEKYKKITITGEGDDLNNNILQILVTIGVFGLFIWLALMFYIFKKQINIYNKTKENKILNCLVLSSIFSMIAFQICGLTDWKYADYPVVTLFWFCISLSFLSEKFLNEDKTLLQNSISSN